MPNPAHWLANGLINAYWRNKSGIEDIHVDDLARFQFDHKEGKKRTDALSSPELVVCRHLLDQGDRLE